VCNFFVKSLAPFAIETSHELDHLLTIRSQATLGAQLDDIFPKAFKMPYAPNNFDRSAIVVTDFPQ